MQATKINKKINKGEQEQEDIVANNNKFIELNQKIAFMDSVFKTLV